MEAVRLEPVEAANVTILVDNAIDILLPSSDVVRRPPLAWEWSRQEQLIAEHGYSLLLEVQKDGRSQSILYDTGLGRETVLPRTFAPWYSPTATRITTAASRGCSGVSAGGACHWCAIPMRGGTARWSSRTGLKSTCRRPATGIWIAKASK